MAHCLWPPFLQTFRRRKLFRLYRSQSDGLFQPLMPAGSMIRRRARQSNWPVLKTKQASAESRFPRGAEFRLRGLYSALARPGTTLLDTIGA
jgi:hypothetical protein